MSALLIVWAIDASCQSLIENGGSSEQAMVDRTPSVKKDIALGNAFLSGHGAPKDEKQAAYWFEKAAQAGDPWAQQQIGFFYDAGIGVKADAARAARWYQLAAASGLPAAKTNLGVAYVWGTGVVKDPQLAAQLLREAAKAGDGRAAAYLGNLYYFGDGVTRDRTIAEHWYKEGARLHNPFAEYQLGTLYSVEDHPHDYGVAAGWLRKSMAAGYVPAVHSLALLLEEHPQLAHSQDECVSLFAKASALGQWRSSEGLGILYRDGRLVARDPKQAYYYFRLALLQGGDAAKLTAGLELLAGEVGAEESARLDAAAQTWYEQHHSAVEFLLDKTMKGALPGMAVAQPAGGVHAGQLVPVPPS